MEIPNWIEEFDGAVTVCDTDYKIIYMNEVSRENFKRFGDNLIGQNLLECHNEESNAIIRKIMNEGYVHSYTLKKKDGRLKAIQQSPWREKGAIKGIVEISFYVG